MKTTEEIARGIRESILAHLRTHMPFREFWFEANRITEQQIHAEIDRRISTALESEREERRKMEEFIRDIASNWVCDTEANGSHPHYCRACSAKKILSHQSNNEKDEE